MRDLEIAARLDRGDIAADPAEALSRFVFQTTFGHQLHADANAEKGATLLAHALFQRVHHSRHGLKPAAAIGKCADAGQHDALGARHSFGIAGDFDFGGDACFPRGAFERLVRRVQIAGAIIDDGDAHRASSGCGKRPTISP